MSAVAALTPLVATATGRLEIGDVLIDAHAAPTGEMATANPISKATMARNDFNRTSPPNITLDFTRLWSIHSYDNAGEIKHHFTR